MWCAARDRAGAMPIHSAFGDLSGKFRPNVGTSREVLLILFLPARQDAKSSSSVRSHLLRWQPPRGPRSGANRGHL